MVSHILDEPERFKDRDYVKDEPNLRYYYGIPLVSDGLNIGALCVFDREIRAVSPEKEELLRIIADEILSADKSHSVTIKGHEMDMVSASNRSNI